MNVLEKLTIKNLRLNKKRTIVTIIGIMLSVALITAVASMYLSAISSLITFEIREQGDFHYAFYDVPAEDIKLFENNRKIEKICLTQHIGYAKLEDSKNESKPYAHIMSFNQAALEHLSVQPVEGRLPENENEIIIPTHLKTNGRMTLNVGDTITLEVGERVGEGEELNQNNPYMGEGNEDIIHTDKVTYKIVGITERPASNIESYVAPGYTFITYMDTDNENITGKVDVYARYTKAGLKNQYRVTATILGVDEDLYEKYNSGNGNVSEQEFNDYIAQLDKARYEMENNWYLIQLETDPLNAGTAGSRGMSALGIVAVIVCGIIIVTSVFCIRNSFDISITEKTRQYGMLRSVGATKKQIRKNVFYEAGVLGAVGIPSGILLGFLASYILVIVSNHFIKGMFSSEYHLRLEFTFSWLAVAFSVILGIITICLSAFRSARRAAKISPITAIRNNSDIRIKPGKLKIPGLIKKVFGIGGEISYKNLKRNKRKYRTTVISIVVSTATFIALYAFIGLAYAEVENSFEKQDYNIEVTSYAFEYQDTQYRQENYDMFQSIVLLDNIEKYTILRNESVRLAEPRYSEEYKKEFGQYGSIEDETSYEYMEIYCLGQKPYEDYIKELGLDYEKVKDKAIFVDKMYIQEYNSQMHRNIYKGIPMFSYQKGDRLPIIAELYDYMVKTDDTEEMQSALSEYGEAGMELEIGCVTDKRPFGFSRYSVPMIIVSDEFFDSAFEEDTFGRYSWLDVRIKSDNADKLQDEIEDFLSESFGSSDFGLTNYDEEVRMMNNFFTLIAIFLYGFIIVISLIGITNIFNTITANMELRRQEFAMLKSVGMTKKEFNRMIRLESIFMGVKSLAFGIPIGILLSYVIHHYLSEDSGIGIAYQLPVIAIVIAVIVVFLLIACIMKYSINKINTQNTIETIRNENI